MPIWVHVTNSPCLLSLITMVRSRIRFKVVAEQIIVRDAGVRDEFRTLQIVTPERRFAAAALSHPSYGNLKCERRLIIHSSIFVSVSVVSPSVRPSMGSGPSRLSETRDFAEHLRKTFALVSMCDALWAYFTLIPDALWFHERSFCIAHTTTTDTSTTFWFL